jgi:hypothetical protein
MTDLQIGEIGHTIAEPWLVEGAEVDAFDKAETIEKLSGRYHLRVGSRPFARSIRAYYAANRRKLPPEYAAMRGEVYVVTHAVGVLADAHPGRVATVGYDASFGGPGSTVDLCPNTRFREWFGADLTFKAAIGAEGSVALPDLVGELASTVIPIAAGAELQLAASAKMLGQLRLSVKTPKVQTVGRASTHVSWQLDKDAEPLVGDQVLVQTVVVPREQETLTFKLQASAMIDRNALGWPVPLVTDTVTVEVGLAEE